MIRNALHIPNVKSTVQVIAHDYVKSKNASIIIRGLRL
ncbi:MAG: hypothetical protein ACLR5T_02030 [Veillonella sp.]